jgi:hypothetical protein
MCSQKKRPNNSIKKTNKESKNMAKKKPVASTEAPSGIDALAEEFKERIEKRERTEQKKMQTKGITLFIPVEEHEILDAISDETGTPKSRVAAMMLKSAIYELGEKLGLGFTDVDVAEGAVVASREWVWNDKKTREEK